MSALVKVVDLRVNAVVLLAAALALYVASLAWAPASGQVTEDEARDLFQRLGCTSCHTAGGTAPPFDEVVAMIESWRGQYASIDEAVAAEVVVFGEKFDTYDAMMEKMATFTGKTLDDIRPLYDFFLQVFQGQAAQPPAEEPGATTTPAEETTTPAQPGETAETPTTPAGEAPPAEGGETPAQPAEEGGAGYALIAGVLLAIIVVGLALLASKRG